jgi:hypothetical protein
MVALSAEGQAETTLSAQAEQLAVAADPSGALMRPRARPGLPAVAVPAAAAAPGPVEEAPHVTRGTAPRMVMALVRVPRPEPRPSRQAAAAPPPVEQVETVAAVRITPGKSTVKGRKGSVCGVNAIKGEALAAITSRVRGCGIENPVRVTSVSGVALSTPATLDCTTAKALNRWVTEGLQPAFGRKEVVQLQVAAHYACRPRNNVKGAKISEHGRGKAIDISGIVLANGKTVSVLGDWSRSAGKPMKAAYRAACGTFGTTLGPGSDRYHRDHMHFDTASNRNGPYCR